jgi:hypothetical protein
MPGITLPVAMFAVERIPQRSAFGIALPSPIRIDMAASLRESRTHI